jgi:hypothetical protein
MDVRHVCLSLTWQYLRGWHANKVREAKQSKTVIIKRLEEMDGLAETQKVDESFWSKRYQVGLNCKMFTTQKNCTGSRGAMRSCCFKVMPTSVSFMLVLMAEGGKIEFVLWRLGRWLSQTNLVSRST